MKQNGRPKVPSTSPKSKLRTAAKTKNSTPKAPSKRRTPVPQTTADEVMVECDRICCVCRRREASQIHHLNEQPSDHARDNLAGLCLECHNDTQITGGFKRTLREGEVRQARDAWCAHVRERRSVGLPRPYVSDSVDFSAMVDAAAVVRIREIGLHTTRGGSLDLLHAFARGFGSRVALEVLTVLGDSAAYARNSSERLIEICSMVHAFLPIRSLVGPQFRPLTPEERDLMHEAAAIGRDVAYGAARRTSDLVTLNAGGRILWSVLRWAVLNKDVTFRESTTGTFSELRAWCARSQFTDGDRWLVFLLDDATQPDDFVGVFPADLADKVHG